MPLWFSEGLAEYFSAGEDSRDEMILRDLTISGDLPTLGQLAWASGGIVYPLGGAIVRFLGTTYGDWRIGELYRELWKYTTFEEAVAGVYGKTLTQLSGEWQYWMRRRYYPAVQEGRPLAVSAEVLARLAIKPTAYRLPGDSTAAVLYFSPSTGYTNIYARPLRGRHSHAVVKGERSPQFESFHFFESRMDVNPKGVVVFGSRYQDRDALFFWNLAKNKVVGRYQFPELVSILSPAWVPDGESVVFSGLAVSGYSDLYRLWLADGRLERLTSDRYQDLDPTVSPDGRTVVFSSDRTAFGPQYVEGEDGIVFGGFADLSWNLYFAHTAPDSGAAGGGPAFALAAHPAPAEWSWPELASSPYARADAAPYEKKYTLDFAAGDAVVAPGLGSAQGALFLFSDLLSDHQVYVEVSSFQGNGLGNLLDNFNGTVFYLNQARRINWGVGAFRLRGLFFESDFSTLFQERSAGAFAQVRYPFSRFRRLEAEYRVEHSDRFDITRPDVLTGDPGDFHRVGWLASNYLSYVKDNTLWLSTGPVDGERYNFTAGLVNDLTHGRSDAWVFSADWRHYYRTSLRSAFAVRLLGYFAGGERPRRISIGGSWALRGYPGFGYVTGTRAWLVNTEWRFPITDFLTIGFPFGALRLPGVQGALFADYGRAWGEVSTARGTLGSPGLGLRMAIGAPLVLRLDFGYRFHSGDLSRYGLPDQDRRSRFVDFFFGFNY